MFLLESAVYNCKNMTVVPKITINMHKTMNQALLVFVFSGQSILFSSYSILAPCFTATSSSYFSRRIVSFCAKIFLLQSLHLSFSYSLPGVVGSIAIKSTCQFCISKLLLLKMVNEKYLPLNRPKAAAFFKLNAPFLSSNSILFHSLLLAKTRPFQPYELELGPFVIEEAAHLYHLVCALSFT